MHDPLPPLHLHYGTAAVHSLNGNQQYIIMACTISCHGDNFDIDQLESCHFNKPQKNTLLGYGTILWSQYELALLHH